MKLKSVAAAAVLATVGLAASAATSTFVDNGGIHEAEEYASNTFAAGSSAFDKYTFTLGTAVTALNSDISFVPKGNFGTTPATGSVELFSAGATSLGSYTFATGMASFGALSAGDYYYIVKASAAKGGGYTLGSYITPVPEPETYALMLGGLGVVGFIARRRKVS